MTTQKRWLEDAVTKYGEPLEAVVVGVHYSKRWGKEALPDENVILTPEQALEKLGDEFDSGFGGADCYPVYAWTKTRVFFIHEYDGATGLNWVPRHPIAVVPEFGGDSVY